MATSFPPSTPVKRGKARPPRRSRFSSSATMPLLSSRQRETERDHGGVGLAPPRFAAGLDQDLDQPHLPRRGRRVSVTLSCRSNPLKDLLIALRDVR